MQTPPVALTIAGSDNSAGAGIQADLKTFTALGVYGLTAVTCVVAEVPGKVSAIQPIDSEIIAEQIGLSFAAFPVRVVKTGMLHSRKIIEAVCDELEKHSPILVVDPVMNATSGAMLLQQDAVELFKTRLFKQALLVTPNLDEVQTLLGRTVTTLQEMREAAQALAESFGGAWLVKGGHLKGEVATDVLYANGQHSEFSSPFVAGVKTHGTGCTYSAAITAGLARGLDLRDSIEAAKRFVTKAIELHFGWGETRALNHFAPPQDQA
ncbi:MAG: hydroxymethylpyrimidine/phosphomethylpyrimidine kinase [Chthoniobacter sp.]|nr:hydroxymethylpyrimidine/phosphomethylpyrimidine kinase [Chthoniobacter sp.]